MLFLINFTFLVTASFCFLTAVLTPNWIQTSITTSNSTRTIQRGVFSLCHLISSDAHQQTTICTSIISKKSPNSPSEWIYDYSISTASLAIGCVSFSLIAIWISGVYFHVRKQMKKSIYFLIYLVLLIFINFAISLAVWILLIVEFHQLGYSIEAHMMQWPFWLAIAASITYLISFGTSFISFCGFLANETFRRNKSYERNLF